MAVDFPNNPVLNQTFVANGITYTWNGTMWIAASGSASLLIANNLSDVQSAPTSRINLGLGTMATQAATAVAVIGGTINATTIGATTPAAASVTSLNGGQLAGMRNRIINGDMRVDQRYNHNGTSVGAAGAYYGADRFAVWNGQTPIRITTVYSSSTGSSQGLGFTNYLNVGIASGTYAPVAADTYMIFTRLEGLNMADLMWGTAAAKPVTLSFTMNTSGPNGTYSGSITSGTRSYVFSWAVTAGVWNKISITIPGDTAGTWVSDNTMFFQLIFDLGCGSSGRTTAGTWVAGNFVGVTGSVQLSALASVAYYLTGVQLEVGSVATPFEQRSYATELALCQRYYQRYTNNASLGFAGYNAAGQNDWWTLTYPTMRVSPTATTIGTWALANCSTPTWNNMGLNALLVNVPPTATGSFTAYNNINSGFDLNAEL